MSNIFRRSDPLPLRRRRDPPAAAHSNSLNNPPAAAAHSNSLNNSLLVYQNRRYSRYPADGQEIVGAFAIRGEGQDGRSQSVISTDIRDDITLVLEAQTTQDSSILMEEQSPVPPPHRGAGPSTPLPPGHPVASNNNDDAADGDDEPAKVIVANLVDEQAEVERERLLQERTARLHQLERERSGMERRQRETEQARLREQRRVLELQEQLRRMQIAAAAAAGRGGFPAAAASEGQEHHAPPPPPRDLEAHAQDPVEPVEVVDGDAHRAAAAGASLEDAVIHSRNGDDDGRQENGQESDISKDNKRRQGRRQTHRKLQEQLRRMQQAGGRGGGMPQDSSRVGRREQEPQEQQQQEANPKKKGQQHHDLPPPPPPRHIEEALAADQVLAPSMDVDGNAAATGTSLAVIHGNDGEQHENGKEMRDGKDRRRRRMQQRRFKLQERRRGAGGTMPVVLPPDDPSPPRVGKEKKQPQQQQDEAANPQPKSQQQHAPSPLQDIEEAHQDQVKPPTDFVDGDAGDDTGDGDGHKKSGEESSSDSGNEKKQRQQEQQNHRSSRCRGRAFGILLVVLTIVVAIVVSMLVVGKSSSGGGGGTTEIEGPATTSSSSPKSPTSTDAPNSSSGGSSTQPPSSSSYKQLGADLNGEAAGDRFGFSVALSSDGSILAIGAPDNDGNGPSSGHVQVYQWDAARERWSQLGVDLDGDAAVDWFGYSVALSSDGNVLAVGAIYNDHNGFGAGHVKVLRYDDSAANGGGQWNQLGADLEGAAVLEGLGESLALSSDGTILAVGAPFNDEGGEDAGQVLVFRYWAATNRWRRLGDTAGLNGAAADSHFGKSVALSADGTVLAVRADANDGNNGSKSGHVQVFRYNTSNNQWLQRGSDLDSEAAGDLFGRSIALSSDGSILAVRDGRNREGAYVRVFQYNTGNDQWKPLGAGLDGVVAGDLFGGSVALSSDGTILAAGTTGNDGKEEDSSGHLRVYQYDTANDQWYQIGANLEGEAAGDWFGWSVALSSDGRTVAGGAVYNDGNGSDSGHVRVFQRQADKPDG